MGDVSKFSISNAVKWNAAEFLNHGEQFKEEMCGILDDASNISMLNRYTVNVMI